MTTPANGRIPAFVNAASGTAADAEETLNAHAGFDVHVVQPDELQPALKSAVGDGALRVLIAGGDGTIAAAATTLMPTNVELAILPGGTLNHFARDLGISTDAETALETATRDRARDVDIGMVNGHVFLNTSSVGAYVRFVRAREYLERRFGYRIASAIAAYRLLFGMHHFDVEIEIDGKSRSYRTPLVFIGVGEREVQLPTLGKRVDGGRRGLHIIAVRTRSRARLLAIALNAVARGVQTAARSPELDSFLVDRCTIKRRDSGLVALDGELVSLDSTLVFELKRNALRVVCP